MTAGKGGCRPWRHPGTNAARDESIDRCLAAAGASLDKVAKVNLYVADFGMIGATNEKIYAQYFKHRPAKTGVGMDKLWGGALIEIEVVASR